MRNLAVLFAGPFPHLALICICMTRRMLTPPLSVCVCAVNLIADAHTRAPLFLAKNLTSGACDIHRKYLLAAGCTGASHPFLFVRGDRYTKLNSMKPHAAAHFPRE